MTIGREDLQTLFRSPYRLSAWQDFLHRHLGVPVLLARPEPIAVPAAEAARGMTGRLLGEIPETADHFKIGFFDVAVSGTQARRRRVGLRNVLVPWLQADYDAALVAFHSTDPGVADWRVSFICDLKGEATAPKRFTYVFGDAGLALRTPLDRFASLGASREGGAPVTMEAMREAFSVEALSDEFFKAYKEHYEKFVSFITGKTFVKSGPKWEEKKIGEPHPSLYGTFHRDDKLVRDYVKKMLGRLVFLHFLQKKGWLGARGDGWTGGDPAFLQNLFAHASADQQADFLDGVLENLFFNALNTDRSASGDLFDTGVPGIGQCRIPYLNGGLFEKDKSDTRRVFFPAPYFRDLLAFFTQYNFTIDENDADEAEVGIDPEMLGRIFENLLEDNKDKGAFYTPKEIVRYMCRRTLLAYLADGGNEQDAAAIADFVETHNPAPLPEPLARQVAQKLRDVKICDPAIGSGAFPMGLLRELHALRSVLEPAHPADLKRQIIENNIYGVDIEKGAVDIARLRFWLALVVDADAPTPLPNLDFKIMLGNSLVESWHGNDLSTIAAGGGKTVRLPPASLPGMDFTPMQLTFFDTVASDMQIRFRTRLHRWFSCSDHAERASLRREINEAVMDLFRNMVASDTAFGDLDPSATADFFLWHLWFAEVFDGGGFDIVIGNPPYIPAPLQIANPVLAAQRRAVASSGRYPSLFEKWDLYLAFLELGMRHLLRNGGQLAMIVPYPLANQKYARKFREAAVRDWTLRELVDLRGVKVFQNATVTNCIPFLEKKAENPHRDIWISRSDGNGAITRLFRQPLSRLVIDDRKAVWNTDETDLSTARHADLPTLGDFCYISVGMVLNAHEKIANGEFTKDDLISETKDEIHCRDYVEGKDLERFCVKRIRYLEYGTSRCPGKIRRPTFPELYTSAKIIVNGLGDIKAVLDAEGTFCCNHKGQMCVPWRLLHGVSNKSIDASVSRYSHHSRKEMEALSENIDLRFLLGILNSRYAQVLLNRVRGGDFNIYPEHLRAIPIPSAPPAVQSRIARLVDRILASKSRTPTADTTALESQIDTLVYSLYNLTPEEIAVVEGSDVVAP